jgi:hypothetical protein
MTYAYWKLRMMSQRLEKDRRELEACRNRGPAKMSLERTTDQTSSPMMESCLWSNRMKLLSRGFGVELKPCKEHRRQK